MNILVTQGQLESQQNQAEQERAEWVKQKELFRKYYEEAEEEGRQRVLQTTEHYEKQLQALKGQLESAFSQCLCLLEDNFFSRTWSGA